MATMLSWERSQKNSTQEINEENAVRMLANENDESVRDEEYQHSMCK